MLSMVPGTALPNHKKVTSWFFSRLKDGKPSGDWEVFADNFAGGADFMQPGSAKHRPCGLAQGPDGSIYVTDDSGGNIYRIMYSK